MSSAKVEIVGLARFGLVSENDDDDDSSYCDSFCANSCNLANRRVHKRTEEAKQSELLQMMEASMSSIGDDESISLQDSFIMTPASPIRCTKRRSSLDNYNNFQSRRASIGSGAYPTRRSSTGNHSNMNNCHNSSSMLYSTHRRGSMGSTNANNHHKSLYPSQHNYQPSQHSTRAYRRSSLGSSIANDSMGDGYYLRVSRRSSLGGNSGGGHFSDESFCSSSFANDSLELQMLFKKSTTINNGNLHTSCSGSLTAISVSSRDKCPVSRAA